VITLAPRSKAPHADEKEPKKMTRRLAALAASATALLLAAPGFASAAGPALALHVNAPNTVTAGKPVRLVIAVENVGDAPLSGELTMVDTFPSGLEPTDPNKGNCAIVAQTDSCSLEVEGTLPGGLVIFTTTAPVEPGAAGTLLNSIEVSGGGAPQILSEDQSMVVGPPEPYAFKRFATAASSGSGAASTQSGSDPVQLATTIRFTSRAAELLGFPIFTETAPVEQFKDVIAHVPPGLIGNPTATPLRCTATQLNEPSPQVPSTEIPSCPPESQVGIVRLGEVNVAPLYNMVPPGGVPAAFGFLFQDVPVLLDAKLRPGDEGVDVVARDASSSVPLPSVETVFWGTPSDPSHDTSRGACLDGLIGNDGSICPLANRSNAAFLRLPTSCSGLLSWKAEANSFPHPETFISEAATSPAMEGCGRLPFNPSFSLIPTSRSASTPTGLDAVLTLPQPNNPQGLATADLKDATVTLPEGMAINPSSADGLKACADAQLELGQEGAAECPEASKIGTVKLETPLLEEEVGGSIYLRTQASNDPMSGQMFRIAVELRDDERGIDIKLPGEVKADPQTGRLTTSFEENPQLPFSRLALHFKSGTRAPLTTPSSCGTKGAEVELSPWSGTAPVHPPASFPISEGCGPRALAPAFKAGTVNPVAGTTSPFILHLSRGDDQNELKSIEATLPPGLSAVLKGVPYCPDAVLAEAAAKSGTAEQAQPSCSVASQIGSVDAAAGEGAPFHVAGKAYLTGPYKGAPLGVAVVVPAVAGPFDLGTVVVRSALFVDETTAQARIVSDPLPQILKGVPLHTRSIDISVNRPNFTLNPTSCEPMQVTGLATSTLGTTAPLANRFQVGECAPLRFEPHLSLALKGKTKRSGNPSVRATLTFPTRGRFANIARARVTLPPAEAIDNAHIGTPCTRVQFAAQQCPKGSLLGYARAFSPLLDKPLEGPVYFRSNGGERLLPDIVADLRGQIHVVLVGAIDAKGKRIRNTFATVPDAPVSKFTLTLYGGKRGYLENTTDLCKASPHALIAFSAHNGKVAEANQRVETSCGGGGGGKGG
jgi:hypothetical protein